MRRRWGEGEDAGSSERRADGRFRESVYCDACGRPVGNLATTEWYTDNDVCGSGDGPGFYLCARKACVDRRDLPVSERSTLYETQRARNDARRAAEARAEKSRRPSAPRIPTAACLRVLSATAVGDVITVDQIAALAGSDYPAVLAALIRFGRIEPAGLDWRRSS